MGWYEWLLFLHVLAAFAMVAALVVFTTLAIALQRVDRPSTALAVFRVGRPAGVLVAVGGMGTLILGIWLAIYVDGYELWDGWIAGALVLWAVTGGTGDRVGKHFNSARAQAERLVADGRYGPSGELAAALRDRRALTLHAISVASLLGLVALMIFKPGA
jgi:hypothetical protein